jgi:hypothetical protein
MKIELKKFLQVKSTEELKRQNQILNELVTDPSSIKQLLVLMESDEVLSLQQLMSILLKKSIAKKFNVLSPEEKEEVKKTILVKFIVMSDRFSENILRRLSESIGVICKLENIKLEQWPELQQTIIQGLEFTDQAKTLKALCLLDSILEINHDYFTFEHGSAIYARLVLIFNSPYNEQLNKLYLLSLKLMAILGYELLENENANNEKELEIIKSLLMSVHTLSNFPGYLENNLADIEKTLLFIFEGLCLSLTQYSHKWEASREVVMDFVLSNSMITNPHYGIGLKSTGADVLMIALKQYKEYFSKDKKDTTLFQKLFKIFIDILMEEEKNCVLKLSINSPDYDEYEYSKEQRQAHFIFNTFRVIATEYSYKNMYLLVKEVFKSLNEYPRLQLNLLISINEGFYSHISREFDTYFGFVFGKLNEGAYSEKVLALRSVSFFLENNTMKVMDKFSDLMNALVLSLNQISSGPIDDKVIYIFDEIMIVLELLVENGEAENVEPFGFNLLQILTQFIQNKNLNFNIRKLALRVVSALITSLTQKQIEEIYSGLMQVLAQSCLEDYLVSETLIAIARLSHYHLKDYQDVDNMMSIYAQTYAPFVKKAAEFCMNPKAITDYELLEGAYSSLYFAVMTLKRNVTQLFSPKIVLLTVEYIESRAFIDEVQAPLSENEDNEEEQKEDLAAYLSNLSFKSMLVAGMHLIGHSMHIFPDEILKESADPSMTINRIKQLLMQQELDHNQDVRCQSFKAFSQMTIGLLEYCNTNIIQDFLNVFQDFSVYEEINIVLNRYLGIINEWIMDLQKLTSHNKIDSKILFSTELLNQISNCIHCILKKQEGFLDPDVLSIICQINETLCSPLISVDYKTNIANKYGNIKIFPKLKSRYVAYPDELIKLLLNYLRSIYQILFEPLANMTEDIDIMCIEELVGSLAELLNKIGFQLIALNQEIFPQSSIVDIVFKLSMLEDEALDRNVSFLLGVIYMHMPSNVFGERLGQSLNLLSSFYQKYPSNSAIQDNCLSSMCKLYMNPHVKNEIQELVKLENLLSQIDNSVPLEGDAQEANFIWKILYESCKVNKEAMESKIISNPRLITFLLKTLVFDKALIEDEIFDWILGLAKNSSSQTALRNITGSLDANSKSKLAKVLG